MEDKLTAATIIEALSRLTSAVGKDLWVHPYRAELVVDGEAKHTITVESPEIAGSIQVREGVPPANRRSVARFALNEADLVLLAQRKVSAHELYATNRLSIDGDELTVLRGNDLFELISQSVERAL